MLPHINVFGSQIPLYGLCILIAFYLTMGIMVFKAAKAGMKIYRIIIIAAMIFLSSIVGGCILYIFVTYPIDYIIDCIKRLDFYFMFSGIIFYGGLFGGFLGALLGSYLVGIKLYELEDIATPLIPLGHAIGRLGCAFAGCCHGKVYDGIFAIKNYAADPTGSLTFFPVQLIEAFLDILIMAYLLYYVKKPHRRYDAIFQYILLYAIMRIFTEMLRFDDIRGFYLGISTSQWISIGLILAFVTRFLYYKIKDIRSLS